MSVELRGEQMDLMDERRRRKLRGMPGVRYSYGGGYVLPGIGWAIDPETGQTVVADPGSGSESTGSESSGGGDGGGE